MDEAEFDRQVRGDRLHWKGFGFAMNQANAMMIEATNRAKAARRKELGLAVLIDLLAEQQEMRQDFEAAAIYLADLGLSPYEIHDLSEAIDFQDEESRFLHGFLMSQAIQALGEDMLSDSSPDPNPDALNALEI